MATLVVGGQSRSVGKTSIVSGLIAALAAYNWTAFKITQYGHGICSRDGSVCDCATVDHAWAITEEHSIEGDTDTSRFLQAGAKRVWWVRTEQGRLAEAMPALRRRVADAENVIIESNSVVKFIRPDLYLTVLDPATADFKKSAQEFLDRADAALVNRSHAGCADVSLKPLAARPTLSMNPPEYITDEIVEFVRERLGRKTAAPA